jgi:hypothetical protein
VADLIAETLTSCRTLAAAQGVVLTAKVPKDLPPAYADPDRFRQILTNLIDNGIKFTPENGMVTVEAQVSDQDPTLLCIAVADTGCGIRPEDTERIFDRLYQESSALEGNHKGLGLGLYICKELVSRHGGQIWVESKPGHGSTFFLTLPIFSLARSLAPILTTKNLLTGSMALIIVEVLPAVNRPLTKAGEPMLREIRNILKRCILSDKDVLLPSLTYKKLEDIFFLAACADQSGAEVIVSRIREQLATCKDLKKAQLTPVISSTLVDIPSMKNSMPLEQIVRDVAGTIEDIVKRKIPQ